jgi:hypothetical protein
VARDVSERRVADGGVIAWAAEHLAGRVCQHARHEKNLSTSGVTRGQGQRQRSDLAVVCFKGRRVETSACR